MIEKTTIDKQTNLNVDTVIVGLGITGLSCARFLGHHGLTFAVTDTRERPPGLSELESEFPEVIVSTGALDKKLIMGAKQCIVSPGVSIKTPMIVEAEQAGIEIIGDIELFARHADAPVVAITGSNGKSTVTTLVYEMAKQAGINVSAGGNLGIPALDLIEDVEPELYVLELSSFQLETTHSLNSIAATVLNISEDHMDRYSCVAEYAGVKEQIFQGSGAMIINADDPAVGRMTNVSRQLTRFTLNEPLENEFGVIRKDGGAWLAFGAERLIAVAEMKIQGLHNVSNALAAMALCREVGIDDDAILTVLRTWNGLAHRCEWIAKHKGVDWYNDSKGTNEGATVAAITGFADKPIILIAGGDGKGAAFNDLAAVADGIVKQAVLFGKDAVLIKEKLKEVTDVICVTDLTSAVRVAAENATEGDRVLLSPACASLDMFPNYIVRGEQFCEAVHSYINHEVEA